MRNSVLVLAAPLACLVIATGAQAQLVGVVTEQNTSAPSEFFVCEMYAEFVDGTTQLLAVSGDPNGAAMEVTALDDLGGAMSFYQDAVGGDTAPTDAQILAFPTVEWDSFVSIGLHVNPGTDDTALTPGWAAEVDADWETGGKIGPTADEGWYNGDPDNTQGDPDGSNRVFIGQLTLQNATAGSTISGTVNIGWKVVGEITFTLEPASVSCVVPPDCPADIDGDGAVGITDFLFLLGAWGAVDGNPPGDDGADLDGDGDVGITDFLQLLSEWGACP